MSAQEREAAEMLAEAMKALPPETKAYMIGYAEGVMAMVERKAAQEEPKAG